MGSSNKVVTYYYRIKSYPYTINYLDADTNLPIEGVDSDAGNLPYGSIINATTKKITIDKYQYDHVDKESLTIGTGSNIMNLYYTKKTGKVIIKYLNKADDSEISQSEEITGKVDTSYNTESKKKTIEGYDYDSVIGDTEGTIGENDITVIYYYKKKVTLTINHYQAGTTIPIKLANNSDAISEVRNLHQNDEYVTSEADKAEYYELVNVIGDTSGTMGSSNKVVTYYYRIKSYPYTINYLDIDTNNAIPGVSANTGDLPYGSTINASNYVIDISKYDYHSSDKDILTIKTEGNVLNLYYAKKKGKVIVKYLDKFTNEEILPNTIMEDKVDLPYLTHAGEKEGYTLVENSGNEEGYYALLDTEVIYKYVLNVQLTVNYINKITNQKMGTESLNSYQGEGYHCSPRDFTDFVLVDRPSVEEGVFGRENIVLNYYYLQISNGVIEKHLDVFNDGLLYNELHRGNEGDPYNISSKTFEGYDLVEERLPDNAIGTMSVELKEVIYYYKKRASITIKYIDEISNEEIRPQETKEGYVNDEWTSFGYTIEGYELVAEPDSTLGRLDYINPDVIYRYRKIMTITTKVNNEGGKIEGDEGVLEKQNSTPKKIVIKADQNHFIEKVTINGEEIEVTDEKEMVLDYFIEIEENKLIEVTFGEIIKDVPKTANNTILPIVAGIMFIIGIILIYSIKGKKKKLLPME